jgi:hypothetical protein
VDDAETWDKEAVGRGYYAQHPLMCLLSGLSHARYEQAPRLIRATLAGLKPIVKSFSIIRKHCTWAEVQCTARICQVLEAETLRLQQSVQACDESPYLARMPWHVPIPGALPLSRTPTARTPQRAKRCYSTPAPTQSLDRLCARGAGAASTATRRLPPPSPAAHLATDRRSPGHTRAG